MMSDEVKNLQEVSVSVSVIDYLALQGLAHAKRSSMSGVIRLATHELLQDVIEVYGSLAAEYELPLTLADRDYDELSSFDSMTVEEVDVAATKIEELMTPQTVNDVVLKEGITLRQEKLKITINVSLSSETIQSIKRIYKMMLYVSQSELLRAAMKTTLNEHIYPYLTPSISRPWQHDTEPAVILAKSKASFWHE